MILSLVRLYHTSFTRRVYYLFSFIVSFYRCRHATMFVTEKSIFLLVSHEENLTKPGIKESGPHLYSNRGIVAADLFEMSTSCCLLLLTLFVCVV